jgi:hypothetical protein
MSCTANEWWGFVAAIQHPFHRPLLPPPAQPAPAPTRMLFFGLVEARRILKNDDRALAIMLSDQIEAAPLGGGARREAMMHAAKV